MDFTRPYSQTDHGTYEEWQRATAPELERLARLPEGSPELERPRALEECRKCGEPLPAGFVVRCPECASE